MKPNRRQLWIYIGTGVFIGLVLLLVFRLRQPRTDPEFQAALLSHHPPGADLNYAGAQHPGDIEKGKKQLLKLYQAILAYRKAHGDLPATWFDLEQDHLITEADLQNDDMPYADNYNPGKFNQFLMWQTHLPRADGSPKPATPAPGERDVWLVSSLYIRRAGRAPDGKDHGAYLVLYSDGAFDEVPMNKVMMVQQKGNAKLWDEAMPNQTGLPPNSVTYAEYASKRGLRG